MWVLPQDKSIHKTSNTTGTTEYSKISIIYFTSEVKMHTLFKTIKCFRIFFKPRIVYCLLEIKKLNDFQQQYSLNSD